MADIVFITAPIGGGKSLLAVKLALNELRNGKRMVVTNLPLYVESAPAGRMTVGEWCHKYCVEAVDVDARLRVLAGDEVREFYLHLPGGVEVPERMQSVVKKYTNSPERLEMLPDLQVRSEWQLQGVIPNGCLYIIDEVHMVYGAREWQGSGKSIEYYMSHLRKLNDDLYLITQHLELVDKNFRRRATEFLAIQNMNKTRLFMGVTIKDRFRAHSFPLQPTRTDNPTTVTTMSLMEEEVCKVYDTMAGAGMSGKLAPEQAKFRGRHWSVWVLFVLLVVGLGIFVPRLVMRGVGRAASGFVTSFIGGFGHHIAQGAVPVPAAARLQVAPVAVGSSDSLLHGVTLFTSVPQGVVVSSNVTVTAVAHEGQRVRIFLSNGKVFRAGDRHVRYANDDGVDIDGVVYPYATAFVPDPNVAGGGVPASK